MSKIQIRGNCQCCGRQQAVVNGLMSKHGYTVEHGWFNGVCSGNDYQPMQFSREKTDSLVAEIRAEVVQLLDKVEQLKNGTFFPKFVSKTVYNPETRKSEKKLIPFAEANQYDQEDAVRGVAWNLKCRADDGVAFSDQLERIANEVFGTDLIKVEKKEIAPILINEKRINKDTGMVYTCFKLEGARVWWTGARPSDNKIMKSWMGTQSWRGMEIV
jgi:hypothetical protein